MSRLFADILAEREPQIGLYCTIAGVPRVFANFHQPEHWTIPDDYVWSRSFLDHVESGGGRLESKVEAVSEKIDWHSGITVSSHLDLQFLLDEEDPDDDWLNLVVPSDRQTWLLDGDIVHKPSATTWQLRSAVSLEGSSINPGDIVHCGPGAAEVLSVDGTSIHVEINKYGSHFRWRGPCGNQRGVPRGSGDVNVTNYAKVWRERPISVWIALCARDRRGYRVPISDSFKQTDGACQEFFAGECADAPVWTAGSPIVGLLCQGVEYPLKNPLIERTRKYRPGPASPRGMGSCYVEPSGPCLVEFQISEENLTFATVPATVAVTSIQGTIDISGSPYFASGKHTFDSLTQVIADALTAQTTDGSGQGVVWRFTSEAPEVDDGVFPDGSDQERPKLRLEASRWHASTFYTGLVGPVAIRVKTAQFPERAALRALGAEEDLIVEASYTTDTNVDWKTALASEEIPHYAVAPGNGWIYYDSPIVANVLCDDPPVRQGTTDLDGRQDGVFVRFGEHEVLEVRFRLDTPGSPLLVDEDGVPRMQVIRRAVLGSASWVTIPQDEVEDAKHELVVGLFFGNHDLFDVVGWLANSNGDPNTGGGWDDPANAWNVLPQGFGAGFIPSRFSTRALEELRLVTFAPKAYGMWLEQAITLRDFLSEVALFVGVNFLSLIEDSRQKLGAVPMEAPPGIESVGEIDDAWTDDVNAPLEPNYDELGIRNRLAFEYDFDPLTQKFQGFDNSIMDGNSIANYGLSEPMEVRVRWLGSYGDTSSQIKSVAAALFRRYADPIIGYKLVFTMPAGWDYKPGQVVKVSRTRTPNYRDGGIGLDQIEMRIEENSRDFGPNPRFGSVSLAFFENRKALPWAPSLRLGEVLLVDGSNTTYRVVPVSSTEAFGIPERQREDLEFFQAAYRVAIYLPGEDDKITSIYVTAVDLEAMTIVLKDGQAASEGYVVEFEDFGNANLEDGQRPFAYLCNDDGVTIDSTGARFDGPKWS